MIPIFEEDPGGRRGYSFAEFKERFFEICADHQRTGRAKLFAFILYDSENPEMLKVLRDTDYWGALDTISGHYLTVFSFQANEPRGSYQTETRFMFSVGPTPDAGYKTQLILRNHFGVSDRIRFPGVLFFNTLDGEVSGYCLAQVEDGTVEATFLRVREVIRLAAETTKAQIVKGRHEPTQIFEAVQAEIRRNRIKAEVWQGLKALKAIADITGLIAMVR